MMDENQLNVIFVDLKQGMFGCAGSQFFLLHCDNEVGTS
jgi:hypothetical protein